MLEGWGRLGHTTGTSRLWSSWLFSVRSAIKTTNIFLMFILHGFLLNICCLQDMCILLQFNCASLIHQWQDSNDNSYAPCVFWRKHRNSENFFRWTHCSHRSLVFAPGFGGRGLWQTQWECGTLTRRKNGQFPWVDRWRWGLGKGHFGAPFLPLVLHEGSCTV